MVTDYKKLKRLFNEFGIIYEEYIGKDGYKNIICENNKLDRSNKIDGYFYFKTCFNFDKDGKFVVMEIYE